MAVNLSAQQFYRGDIVNSVRRALDASGMDAQWLELELTEGLTLDDTETTIKIMADLKELGSSSRLMISGPAGHRFPTCAASRSTGSRSTVPS
jgi:EAL domain-containing protein (putative c-di-GMP-specific phosphodiesterase class I)